MNTIHAWPRRLKNFLRHFSCNSPGAVADAERTGATAAAMVLYAALCGSIYLAAQHWLFRLYQGRDVSEMTPSAPPASRCDRAALP